MRQAGAYTSVFIVRSVMRFRPAFLAAVSVLAATSAAAQKKALTLDDLYDPEKKVDFSGNVPSGVAWTSDTHYVYAKTDGGRRTSVDRLRVEAVSGKSEPHFDAAKMEQAL